MRKLYTGLVIVKGLIRTSPSHYFAVIAQKKSRKPEGDQRNDDDPNRFAHQPGTMQCRRQAVRLLPVVPDPRINTSVTDARAGAVVQTAFKLSSDAMGVRECKLQDLRVTNQGASVRQVCRDRPMATSEDGKLVVAMNISSHDRAVKSTAVVEGEIAYADRKCPRLKQAERVKTYRRDAMGLTHVPHRNHAHDLPRFLVVLTRRLEGENQCVDRRRTE